VDMSKKCRVWFFSILFLMGLVGIGKAEEKQIATLSAYLGEVLLQKAGETTWQRAEEGTFLFEEDKIQTKEDSSAEIIFDYENVIELSQNSLLEIKSLKIKEDDSKESLLKLEIGRVLAEVGEIPASSKFEIHTPTAVAGVRGTEFLVEEKDGESSVAVFKGKVGVRGIAKEGLMANEVLIPANYQTSVLRHRNPQIPYGLSKKMFLWKKNFAYLEKRRNQSRTWWQGLNPSERNKLRENINKYKKLPFKRQQEIKKKIEELGWKKKLVQSNNWQPKPVYQPPQRYPKIKR